MGLHTHAHALTFRHRYGQPHAHAHPCKQTRTRTPSCPFRWSLAPGRAAPGAGELALPLPSHPGSAEQHEGLRLLPSQAQDGASERRSQGPGEVGALRVQGPAWGLRAAGIYLVALPERSPRVDEGRGDFHVRLPGTDITGVRTAPEMGSTRTDGGWAFVQRDGPHCGCRWSKCCTSRPFPASTRILLYVFGSTWVLLELFKVH